MNVLADGPLAGLRRAADVGVLGYRDRFGGANRGWKDLGAPRPYPGTAFSAGTTWTTNAPRPACVSVSCSLYGQSGMLLKGMLALSKTVLSVVRPDSRQISSFIMSLQMVNSDLAMLGNMAEAVRYLQNIHYVGVINNVDDPLRLVEEVAAISSRRSSNMIVNIAVGDIVKAFNVFGATLDPGTRLYLVPKAYESARMPSKYVLDFKGREQNAPLLSPETRYLQLVPVAARDLSSDDFMVSASNLEVFNVSPIYVGMTTHRDAEPYLGPTVGWSDVQQMAETSPSLQICVGRASVF
jgi:hypothetical protein